MAYDSPREVRALSAREREILSLLAEGLNGKEVADELHVSIETARTHVRNTMRKLNARTRVHALAVAVRSGQISL